MSVQKDLLFEQLDKTVSALGEQIKLAPVYSDNHKAHDPTKTDSTPDRIKTLVQNKQEYGGYKIQANSSSVLDDHLFLVIDYDDHRKDENTPSVPQRRIALHKQFNLPPTFSVKTPSGAGIHEYFLIPKDAALTIGTWSQYIGLPHLPDVEIKLGLPHLGSGFPGPGTHRDGAHYIIEEERELAKVSDEFIGFLLAKRQKQKEEFTIPTGTTSDTDSDQNIRNAQDYIRDATLPYLTKKKPLCGGPDDGRNNRLYGLAMECFRRNLSIEMTQDLLVPVNNNPKIFLLPLEDDELDAIIKSAYRNTQENKLYHSKAVDPELELFKKDEYGQKTMSYASYVKKTELLSKYSKDVIMNDERLRRIFCELVIMCGNQYYIPRKFTEEMVIEEIENQLKDANDFGTTINVDAVSKRIGDAALSFNVLIPAEFNAKYKVLNANNRLEPLTKQREFERLHVDVDPTNLIPAIVPVFKRENIYERKRFYLVEQASAQPIDKNSPEYPTEREFNTVKELLDKHIRRLVDPNNFEQERDFLLGRYALLLQKPNTRTENILILRGEQGTGKSAFFNIFRPLFHSSQTKNFDSGSRLEDSFTTLAYISHFDDCQIDFNVDTIAKLKNISTSATQYVNKKGVDAVEVIRPVNISITTNNDIENLEALSGRRWTILNNSEIPDRELVRQSVSNTYKMLIENNFRLYKVFATYMQEFPANKFKSNFKSAYQQEKCSEMSKGHPFVRRLLGIIVNYGYYSPTIRVLNEDELITRLDLFDLLIKHKPLKSTKEVRGPSFFLEIEDRNTKERSKNFWKKVIPQRDIQKVAKISGKTGYTYESPTIQDLIKMIAVFMYDSLDTIAIDSVIKRYKLEPHWNWKMGDEMFIPEGVSLGDIDPFVYMDPDDIDGDDEDDF